jgi:hypothetical protein
VNTKLSTVTRIQSHLDISRSTDSIEIFGEEGCELQHAQNCFSGTVTVSLHINPMALKWRSEAAVQKPKVSDEADVIRTSRVTFGVLVEESDCLVASGYVQGAIEIGKDSVLERAVIYFVNFPQTGPTNVQDTATQSSWSRVPLGNNEWVIEIDPLEGSTQDASDIDAGRKNVINGIGEIRRRDGASFSTADAKNLVEALGAFLSFSFADWCYPVYMVGFSDGNPVWQYARPHATREMSEPCGWLHPLHVSSWLSAAFPGFLDAWNFPGWSEPLRIAIAGFVESCKPDANVEVAVLLGQIPLEILGFLKCVDSSLTEDKYDKIKPAAKKIRLLLENCSISVGIPASLKSLVKTATEIPLCGNVVAAGPEVAVEIRNCVVHCTPQRRKLIDGWQRKQMVNEADLYWESNQLFREYFTLVMLNLAGYKGEYRSAHPGRSVSVVPWAPKIAAASNGSV